MEGVEIDISRRRERAADLARNRHLLRAGARVVWLVLDHDRDCTVGEEDRIRASLESAQPVGHTVERRLRRPNRLAPAQAHLAARFRGDLDRPADRLEPAPIPMAPAPACRRAGCGQKRDCRRLARVDGRRDHRVEVRHAADLQSVEMIVAAAVDEVPDLHNIRTVGRRGEVEKGVLASEIARVAELHPLVVVDHDRAVELAVDPPGPAVDEDALALLGRDPVAIDVGRLVDASVDDHRQRDRLRLAGLVVGLGLDDLGPVGDHERPEVRQPARSRPPARRTARRVHLPRPTP